MRQIRGGCGIERDQDIGCGAVQRKLAVRGVRGQIGEQGVAEILDQKQADGWVLVKDKGGGKASLSQPFCDGEKG